MSRYHFEEQELKLIEGSSIPCAVYQFIDKRVVTIALSSAFCEMLHYESMEEAYRLMDNDMYRDVHPEDAAWVANAAVQFATQGGEYNVVYRTKVDGDYIILHAIGHHVYMPTGERLAVIHYVNEGVYQDEDFDRAGLRNMQTQFIESRRQGGKYGYDYLTGLPEMNYFFELGEAAKERYLDEGDAGYILFMNLNGMKSFNLSFGYAEGDRLIQAFSRLLVRYFSNDNCCRTTADHFAVYTNKPDIEEVLKNLMEDAKHINGGNALPVRIGVYSATLGWISVAAACDMAKLACDSVENEFASTYTFFDQEMVNRYEGKHYILENIDRAIEEGWLQVYYQPIIRAANGRVCDEEALARWIDPKRGLIPPEVFIPILEEAKLTYKMDLYVADQVLKKINMLKKAGLYLVPNSINLSRTDFYACDMVEEIDRRVQEAGVERRFITIELTESYVMEDTDFIRVQVERFQKLGYRVWMDDFGSGYSTPDLLQKIHFDVVKIDKNFVDKIETSEENRVIITELMRLAAGLGSETVAEGVETDAQVEFLKEIGCTRLQGFNYCQAIPVEKIFERYEKGIQVGFENPEESEYYSAIGNINLYDMSFSIEDSDSESTVHYFDTMPMCIMETKEEGMRLVRGNKSYREFVSRYYPGVEPDERKVFTYEQCQMSREHIYSILEEKSDGEGHTVDLRGSKGDVIHVYSRRIAKNPVNGSISVALMVLGCEEKEQAQKRWEENERLAQERKTYNRIMALSGDFLCIYSVDPKTDHYMEYGPSELYKKLGVASEGNDFYGETRKNGADVVYIEDMDVFQSSVTKENVMREIEKNGVFVLNYRLRIAGVPRYVSLKATIVEEEEGPVIVFGLIDTDAKVKKDEEYARKLLAARDIANLDALTGVKNKHAYTDAESQM
ncbi:MAG: EAL domain-containing protein, partial [Lachnospiraceae bacterium]|nr:EAL domain-containing protein [Lachnospiraceae bacterium]